VPLGAQADRVEMRTDAAAMGAACAELRATHAEHMLVYTCCDGLHMLLYTCLLHATHAGMPLFGAIRQLRH
jgi:hypothetical protein